MSRSVFDAAGGMDGLRRLAAAWHARVMADEVVSHAFSHGFHPQHTERLAAYWAEALGGPPAYSDAHGDETSVVRMHSGNGVHDEMDRRAIACFDEALTDVGIGADDRLRQVLHDYFAWATTTSMSRYHRSAADVPNGLRIPRWSWAGLVEQPAMAGPALTFREVTDANRAEVVALGVAPDQDRFVSSVAESMEEAVEWARAKPWYRAVYAGNEPIGFVMLSWNVEPQPPDIIGPWFLWKLLVDARHQGRGYGREIVRMVADLVRGEGATELLTSHVPGDGGPAGFYAKLRFVPTGALDPDGEIILRLDLT